ncbi:Uncharacterized protein FKW44_002536, partial [Caligus rogercresseyi]
IYNSTTHAFVDCLHVQILKKLVALNVNGHNNIEVNVKACILFGVMEGQAPSENLKAMECALLGAKSLIASKLCKNDPVETEEIRAVIISSAARYSSFSLKIPNTSGAGWQYAADLFKFYPKVSAKYFTMLKNIINIMKLLKEFSVLCF